MQIRRFKTVPKVRVTDRHYTVTATPGLDSNSDNVKIQVVDSAARSGWFTYVQAQSEPGIDTHTLLEQAGPHLCSGAGVAMPITRKDAKEFTTMFAMQFFLYCIVSVSYRAMAQGRYLWTGITDTVYGYVAFYVIKNVARSESKIGLAGYVIGGTCGSLLAIYITQRLWGM